MLAGDWLVGILTLTLTLTREGRVATVCCIGSRCEARTCRVRVRVRVRVGVGIGVEVS